MCMSPSPSLFQCSCLYVSISLSDCLPICVCVHVCLSVSLSLYSSPLHLCSQSLCFSVPHPPILSSFPYFPVPQINMVYLGSVDIIEVKGILFIIVTIVEYYWYRVAREQSIELPVCLPVYKHQHSMALHKTGHFSVKILYLQNLLIDGRCRF